MDLRHFKFGFRGSRQGTVIYATVPKAGCSTIQLTLANEYARVSGRKPLHTPHNPLKKEYFILFNDPARSPLPQLLDTRLLFSIVRNPYSRLLSAYLDKIYGKTKEYDNLLANHGLASGRDLSFSDFVHLVSEESFDQMDQHWAPQRGIISWDIFTYGYLGFQESLSEDLLACLTGRGLDTKAPHNFASHSRSASNKLHDFYNEELRRIVYRTYKGDFEAFGYSEDIGIATADRSVSAAGMDRPYQIKPEYQGLIAAHDAMSRRDIQEATANFDRWLPEAERNKIVDVDDYQFAGQLYLRARRFDEAQKMLEKALAVRPDKLGVLVGLARCAVKVGNLDRAEQFAGRVEQAARPHTTAAKFALSYRQRSARSAERSSDPLAPAPRSRFNAQNRIRERAVPLKPLAVDANMRGGEDPQRPASKSIAPVSEAAQSAVRERPARRAFKKPRRISDIDGIESAALLFENAEKVADRLQLERPVLDFLYKKTRWPAMPRATWEAKVQTACAIDYLLSTFHRRAPFEEFESLIDRRAQTEFIDVANASRPTLIVSFHGAFAIIARKLFSAVANGEILGKGGTIPVGADFRNALFTGLRTLQDGRDLFIAPDGPEGKLDTTLNVLGTSSLGAQGAAFLAHTSNCRTAWFTVTRQGHRFVPVIVPGPTHEVGESFEDFSKRFFGFYCERIEAIFTGDPQNISLRPRWRRLFGSVETSSPTSHDSSQGDRTAAR